MTPGSWPWRAADRVRAALREACRGLPADAGGLLPSLVDGDGSTLPDPLRADLTTAGLTHLTAVSGANLSIIAESALWVAGAVRAPRRLRIVLLLLTLLAFVVLARPSPSVLRAAAMGGVGVTAAALARRPRAVPALAAASVVLLAADPYLARSAGFALSVVATGGLLLLAPVWADALGRRLPRPLALAVAAPAAAQVACGPVLVLLQPAVSLVAVPANLVAEPAVAPTTVLGVVAAVVGTVAPPVAHLVAVVAALGTAWISVVAHRAAALPLASVPWPSGVAGAAMLAVLEAGFVVVSVPAGRAATGRALSRMSSWPASAVWGWGSGSRGTGRRAAGASWSVRREPCSGWSGSGSPGYAHPGRPPACRTNGPWRWRTSGRGTPPCCAAAGDRAVLVDAGPDPRARRRRPAAGCGVRHLDLVVLTHFHADHVGGLAGALAGRSVGGIVVSPLREPAENVAAVVRLAGAAGVPVVTAVPGQSGLATRDGWRVAWRVLTPSGAPVPLTPPESDDSDVVNESSVAVVAELAGPGGDLRAVLLGDLETQGQRALAERLAAGADGLGGPVDVVKVAHHGSAKQHEALYRSIDARVALIGVGAGQRLRAPGAVRARPAAARRPGRAPDGPGRRPRGRRAPRRRAPALHGARIAMSEAVRAGGLVSQGRGRVTPCPAAPPGPPAAPPARPVPVAPDDLRPEPVVLVVGPEDLLAERAVAAVLAAAREADPGVTVEQIDAAGYEARPAGAADEPSLFGGGTVVVVEGVAAANDAFVTDALAYVAAPAPEVCLVLRHSGGQRAKALLDQARKAGAPEAVCAPITKDDEKLDFVAGEFRRAGRRASPQAMRALVDAVGSDLRELAAACRQLAEDAVGSGRGADRGRRRGALVRGAGGGHRLPGGGRRRRRPGRTGVVAAPARDRHRSRPGAAGGGGGREGPGAGEGPDRVSRPERRGRRRARHGAVAGRPCPT